MRLLGDFPNRPTLKRPTSLPDPEEAVAGMSTSTDSKSTALPRTHDHQPIAMAFDDRNQFMGGGVLYLCRGTNEFDLNLRDRIVILEDVDGDERADKKTIFHDDLQRLTGLTVGFGGVWATCANLLFIPDADQDDRPDAKPEVVLNGWNDNSVRHNMVNGLKWGPDGWLYGRHGIQALSTVGPPACPRKRTNLKMLNLETSPEDKKFEVVCEGTTNPWGHDWDEHGQLFFINTVIGHFWHGLPEPISRECTGNIFAPDYMG